LPAQRYSLVDRQRLEIDNTTRAERNTTWGTSTGEPQCRRNASRSGSDDSDREYRGDLQMGRIDMIESLIVWLIIGAIAGWLAGQIVKGYGLGLVGNIVVGIIGAIIAGWLLPMIGFVLVGGILAAIVNAVIGAVILLIIVGFFKK
jgi:uncharacterized membrane protein YeaQ/YmgE (transglycosylase-associated protein family)